MLKVKSTYLQRILLLGSFGDWFHNGPTGCADGSSGGFSPGFPTRFVDVCPTVSTVGFA